MLKKAFLEILVPELERLETIKHVKQMGEQGRYKEIDEVLAEVNYLLLNGYMQSNECETLKISDIPKDHLVACLIYLSHSDYSDMEFFEDWEKLPEKLKELGAFANLIAERLECTYINLGKSFAKFMEDEIE